MGCSAGSIRGLGIFVEFPLPVKKSTALLQTTITFVPSLRLSCFFVLIAAEFDRLSEKPSRRERLAHLMARCCVDCRRFLASCFCLYPHQSPTNGNCHVNAFSLRNKRPDLPGRPPCKNVAIGVARGGGGRPSGGRTLRVPPSCIFPASYAGGPHVASLVVGRWRVRSACACLVDHIGGFAVGTQMRGISPFPLVP